MAIASGTRARHWVDRSRHPAIIEAKSRGIIRGAGRRMAFLWIGYERLLKREIPTKTNHGQLLGLPRAAGSDACLYEGRLADPRH